MDLLLCKILKSWSFLTALLEIPQKGIFLSRKNEKLLQLSLCQILATPLQPPLNFVEFGAPVIEDPQYLSLCCVRYILLSIPLIQIQ